MPAAIVLSVLPAACGTPRDLTGGEPGGGLAPLEIVTSELPAATAQEAYSHGLAATGGNGVYAWSLAEGALPDGLSLDATGAISGTPTVAGTFTFIVQVSSGDGQIVTRQLSMNVAPASAEAPRDAPVAWAALVRPASARTR